MCPAGEPGRQDPWHAKVITLFPELFPGPLGCSLAGKALRENLWSLETIDLRRFGLGSHKLVDDRPVGGGPGMVFRPDVVASALDWASRGTPSDPEQWPVICLTPRGQRLGQPHAVKWSAGRGMTLLCGRFEGIDERVIRQYGMTEISIGDFVMSGGEIAAHALIDSVVRLIPSVLGNQASVTEESHTANLLEYPQFTRPRIWQGIPVPDILLTGNHAEIANWRKTEAIRATKQRRPDMWQAFCSVSGGPTGGESKN